MDDNKVDTNPEVDDYKDEATADKAVTTEDIEAKNLTVKDRLVKLWLRAKSHKLISLPIALALLLGLLLAVPTSRYSLLGMFVSRDITYVITESKTNKPVSEVEVVVGSQKGKTNNKGEVRLKNKVGEYNLHASKKYYADVNQTVVVPIMKPKAVSEISITATGRQVPVKVINSISGKTISEATVSVLGVDTKTDSKGEAVIVLPADRPSFSGSVSMAGFVKKAINVKVTESFAAENNFSITPDLYVYFLSNASGKIDLAKARLDGSDRQVVLAGTGREQEYSTQMIASYDWRYIALLSRRDNSDKPKLYMFDTSSNNLSTIDSNHADYYLHGWSGDKFYYRTTLDVDASTTGRQLVKQYDSNTKKIANVYKTSGVSDDYPNGDELGHTYLLGSDLFMIHQGAWGDGDSKVGIVSISTDTGQAKTVKDWTAKYISSLRTGPLQLNLATDAEADNTLYTYSSGSLKAIAGKTPADLYQADSYQYLFSPDQKTAFRSELRDGKSVVISSALSGSDSKEVATLNDSYGLYGWQTQDYLVLFKGSDLYATSISAVESPKKIGGYTGEIGSQIIYGNSY